MRRTTRHVSTTGRSMRFVLAIEPDERQARNVAALLRDAVKADALLVDSLDAALATLDRRVPDLLLISRNLSAAADTALAVRLRTLGHPAGRIRTLVIPALAIDPSDQGSDPMAFAAQVNVCLDPDAVAAATAPSPPHQRRPHDGLPALRPMQDEWGLYDPEQCGIPAVISRVEALTRADAHERRRRERSAIMRR